MKKIKQIFSSQIVDMGGIKLDQPLPNRYMDQLDPVLLIHHWKDEIPAGSHNRDTGVGPHPHRGFSPVTFIYAGAVRHRDSRGNDSVIEAGGTQWMHAGMGIVHSERPPKELAKAGGPFEIIQFWMNEPATSKMTQPAYYPLTKEETPTYQTEDGSLTMGVVAGEFRGLKGSIPTFSRMTAWRFTIKEDAEIEIKLPADQNLLLYTLDGDLILNNKNEVNAKQMVIFEKGAEDRLLIAARENTRGIILGGEPIDEPVVQYGPFVMNTQTEVMEALRDAQIGKMGILVE